MEGERCGSKMSGLFQHVSASGCPLVTWYPSAKDGELTAHV
jgi:hypothetical protein